MRSGEGPALGTLHLLLQVMQNAGDAGLHAPLAEQLIRRTPEPEAKGTPRLFVDDLGANLPGSVLLDDRHAEVRKSRGEFLRECSAAQDCCFHLKPPFWVEPFRRYRTRTKKPPERSGGFSSVSGPSDTGPHRGQHTNAPCGTFSGGSIHEGSIFCHRIKQPLLFASDTIAVSSLFNSPPQLRKPPLMWAPNTWHSRSLA